ncbi:unnamed protein product [Euphydryas editha]|uniref:Reverse transcriptase domain-containing protein n=1 Tax=Euphydryas editha TaxID=104508 RepID=A0AAU9V0L9_EUPED|nr:unnamed protein product [Euphydryas editha]
MELPQKAIIYLTTLFNSINRRGYFPALWKVSQVIMIHKPGKPPHEVTSYRPISLLPVLSKLLEKILLRRLSLAMHENSVTPNHQFDFRPEHATIEQIHRVCKCISNSLEQKEYCSSVFLDVQQAFDRVWHKGLLCKVKLLLPHNFYPIIESYLRDRIFQVKESDCTSGFYDILAGVPQGSVLGPILYTIFTADLPQTPGVTIATYADDTAILTSSKDPVQASTALQRSLDEIDIWLDKWRIVASANKSVQVTFTLRKGTCPPVRLGGRELPQSNKLKYLGLHLDRRLTWKNHIESKRNEELRSIYKPLRCITRSCSNVKPSEDPEKKPGLIQRFKQMYKDYWYVLLPVHMTTSAIWFGGFYYCVRSGVDVISLLESIGISDKLLTPLKESNAGYFALALALYKLITPLRYAVTVGGTTYAINRLTAIGWIKPVPSREQIKVMFQEKKDNIQDRFNESKQHYQTQLKEKGTQVMDEMKRYKTEMRNIKNKVKKM